MAIRIQQLANSTITAQAVAGGDLLADTTYYVCCVWNMTTAFRDGDAHSDFTNEVSVLTTSVNKSIQVNYSWTVNIASFADAGSGQVRVTVDDLHHCLLNGNSVTIAGTTNYNGDYIIVYDVADVDGVDSPNEFRITHSWDGDDATGTVMCDDDVIGSNNYISVRVSTTPLFVGGEPTGIAYIGWIGPGYSAPPAVQGYTITTQPLTNGIPVRSYMPLLRKDSFPKGITRYDRPYFEITQYETWASWHGAMTTWLPTNTNYYYDSLQTSAAAALYFLGSMKMQSLTTLMTITHITFTLDGGIYAPTAANGIQYLKWWECWWRQLGVRRPQITGTFENTAIRNECQDGAYMDKALIVNCGLYPNTSYVFYGTTSAQLDGAVLTLNDDNRYFWYVYPRLGTKVQNLDVLTGYFYIYSPNYDSSVSAGTHYMENINIYSTYDAGTPRDLYMYQPTGNYIIEMLNVRAPLQTNGIVRCLRSHAANDTAKFYFSVTLHVVDDAGNDIVGATVRLTDSLSTEYEDDTDSNGNVTLNVLSYINEPGLDTFGDYTFYGPFTLEVEYALKQTYIEDNIDLYDKIEKTIALQTPSGETVPETVIYGAELYDATIY